ncbi:hypothetical protein [Candidatus Fukatsuia symbiotica]|uniref:hypothetical protein n=1 Tax=Candidatus Fukatsuia symbiotica TaxID=1878942 RepID=UPI0013C5310F|nr:hypothetical protein [Candidatus Fukatsuia symbiotica]
MIKNQYFNSIFYSKLVSAIPPIGIRYPPYWYPLSPLLVSAIPPIGIRYPPIGIRYPPLYLKF